MCTQREKEIIAFAMKYKPRLFSVDCSQRIDRTTMEDNGIIPTITPSARNFLAYVPGIKQPSTDSCWGWRASCLGFPRRALAKV